MKIAYHHRTASRDGQEVHIRELIAALRALGHEVRIISPAGSDAEGAAMGGTHGGVARVRALVPDALMPLASRAYDAVFARRLAREVRGMGADVIYERHALLNRVGVRAARLSGVPLLLEVNAPLAREQSGPGRTPPRRTLAAEMQVIRAADAVLAVTRVLRDVLIADGAPPERVHVLPNGIDPVRFLDPPRADTKRRLALSERLVLGFVGFPRPWHGLELAVEALGRHRQGVLADAVLLIGGEGPALAELTARAEQLGVRDRLILHGVVQRADVPAFIDAFDVALQPRATAYASPLKLFEYLARGVPVLAPRQPNIEEVLQDGISGMLYAPDEPGAFDRALLALAADGQRRQQIGAAGRERLVAGGFTWPENARRVAEIARQLT